MTSKWGWMWKWGWKRALTQSGADDPVLAAHVGGHADISVLEPYLAAPCYILRGLSAVKPRGSAVGFPAFEQSPSVEPVSPSSKRTLVKMLISPCLNNEPVLEQHASA